MKQELKKQIMRRLKILEGQVRGLHRMVDEEKYCVDIINQSSAVKKALSGVESLLLKNHLSGNRLRLWNFAMPNTPVNFWMPILKSGFVCLVRLIFMSKAVKHLFPVCGRSSCRNFSQILIWARSRKKLIGLLGI